MVRIFDEMRGRGTLSEVSYTTVISNLKKADRFDEAAGYYAEAYGNGIFNHWVEDAVQPTIEVYSLGVSQSIAALQHVLLFEHQRFDNDLVVICGDDQGDSTDYDTYFSQLSNYLNGLNPPISWYLESENPSRLFVEYNSIRTWAVDNAESLQGSMGVS